MKPPTKPALALLALLLALSPRAASAEDDGPAHVDLRVEIWQAPRLDAIEILDRARGKSNTHDITLELRESAKSGKPHISLVAVPSITARSGQRAKTVSGANTYTSGYKVDSKTGQEVPEKSTSLSGTSLEVDPVIGADGVSLDINLAVQHALEAPVLTERTVVGPVSGKELTVQSATENRADLTTSLTMLTGQARLLGSIPAKNDDSFLVFLIAEIVKSGE